jgi:hypothetical protein
VSASRTRWLFVAHCALALVGGAHTAVAQERASFGDTEGCAPSFVNAVSDILVLRGTATSAAIIELQCLRSAVVVTVRRSDATFVRGIEVSDVPARSRPRLVGILLGELLGRRDRPPRPPPAPDPRERGEPDETSEGSDTGDTSDTSERSGGLSASREAGESRETSEPRGRTAGGTRVLPRTGAGRGAEPLPLPELEASGLLPARPWPGPTLSLRPRADASATGASGTPMGARGSEPPPARSPAAPGRPDPGSEPIAAANADELAGSSSSAVDEFETSLPRLSEPLVRASVPRGLDARSGLGAPRRPATSMPPALWLEYLEPPASRPSPVRIDGNAALRILPSTPFVLGGVRARAGFDVLEVGALVLASGFADTLGQATVWSALGELSLLLTSFAWRDARWIVSSTIHGGVVGVEAMASAGALGPAVLEGTAGATVDLRGAFELGRGIVLVGQAGLGAAYGPMLWSGQDLRAGLGGLLIDVSLGLGAVP